MGGGVAWEATNCMGRRVDAMSVLTATDNWLLLDPLSARRSDDD